MTPHRTCEVEECNNPIFNVYSPGHPRKYCSPYCKHKAAYRRRLAINPNECKDRYRKTLEMHPDHNKKRYLRSLELNPNLNREFYLRRKARNPNIAKENYIKYGKKHYLRRREEMNNEKAQHRKVGTPT